MKKVEIIIDKEFLKRFAFEIFDGSNEFHLELKKIFRSCSPYKIITDFSSVEELIHEAENNNPFIHNLIDTGAPEIDFRPNLHKEIIQPEFYQKSSPIKLFFISENCDQISKIFGFDYITPDNFNNKELQYHIRRENSIVKTTSNTIVEKENRFTTWEILNKYKHPLSWILIHDRYFLGTPDNIHLKNNILPLLQNLILCSQSSHYVDIIIVSRLTNHRKIKEFYNKIIRQLEKNNTIKFKLTIVNKPPDKKDKHPRRIFTNYLRICADNSFDIYKESGIFKDELNDISFGFIFNAKELQHFTVELSEVLKYIDSITNRPQIGYEEEKVFIYPEKVDIFNSES